MTTQGVARRIHLFRKVVRSALIGVHSLDQIDVGRANFLFGRSRLQTENLQRAGDARAFVAMGLARLPALGLSPSPFPPSPFIGVFLLYRRPSLAMTASSAGGARRVLLEKRANARQSTKIPKATGTMKKSAKSEPLFLHEIRVEEIANGPSHRNTG
jgi:hypothetical protein